MKSLILCILFFRVAANIISSPGAFLYPQPDTIPPPPPGGPLALTGPGTACLGDTSIYSTEVPLASTCQWSVDGVILPDTSSTFPVTWTQTGNHSVSVVFVGAGGQSSEPQTLITYVGTAPPSPIQGPSQACEGVQQMYTTTVGQGEVCRWVVDGELQSTTATTLFYTFPEPGLHEIEVSADGPCGTGDPVSKEVMVQILPEVFLGNDTTLQTGQTLLLDAGNPGANYLWSTGATTQTIFVSVTGIYSVDVTTACGTDSDEIAVTILVSIPETAPSSLEVSFSGRKYVFPEISGKPLSIQVFDLQCRRIHEGVPGKNIDISMPGIYLVRCLTDKSKHTLKIIIP
jgi:hypothetical protein